MWDVVNNTRFKVDRCFTRNMDGAEVWIVAVRATFHIGDNGALTPAEEQQDVCLVPTSFGEPGRSSLRYDLDLVRAKTGTDVIINAHAHAPNGRPLPYVDVGWSVGPVMKSLRVYGDRVWRSGTHGLVPSEPRPFASMPIRYERAWGGPLGKDSSYDPYNPVGTGASAAPGSPVPNCEYRNRPIRSHDQLGPPAGFGPIACNWQPRVSLAGTFDDAWRNERQPLPPKDARDEFFRCAPRDQQIDGFLAGGEVVLLRHLTPEGFAQFRLPRIALGFQTRINTETVSHRGRLYTVIVEPEERQVIMVWQTSLPCHHTLYTLKETIVFEKEWLLHSSQDDLDEEFAE
jgi:hypothetical protein